MGNGSEPFMQALEESVQFVATMTGIKKQFIDAGWSDPGAEAMTLEMLRKSGQVSK